MVDALQRASVPYLVVEIHHEALAGPLEQGLPVVWGDISSEDILRAAGIPQARMLAMAVPEWHAIRLGIDRAKPLNPRLFVVARATAAATWTTCALCGLTSSSSRNSKAASRWCARRSGSASEATSRLTS